MAFTALFRSVHTAAHAAAMEVFFSKNPRTSILRIFSMRWQPQQNYVLNFAALHPLLSLKRLVRGNHFSHAVLQSKKSLFQDFQGFAEPSKLLQVTEAKFCSGLKLEEILAFSSFRMSNLYIIQLFTSIEFGSDLVDNSAILLCLIDREGNSVLQRITATSIEDLEFEKGVSDSKEARFQRGSVETITFQGPEMGKVNALWIGLESGSWRLSNVQLLVVDSKDPSDIIQDLKEFRYRGQKYEFEFDDLLLGEGDGESMTELRPKLTVEFQMVSTSSLFSSSPSPILSSSERRVLSEKSMKEYTNLKLTLLVYDLALVSAGTVAFILSMGPKASAAFLVGGISGFLYLFLLQKYVDGISASTSDLVEEGTKNITQGFGGFKGPLAKFALILALFAAVVEFGLKSNKVEVTSLEFLILAVGFLTYRIAVLFAAFKPLAIDEQDNL